MTALDIIKLVKWKEVKRSLLYFYPKYKPRGWKKVFKRIKKLDREKQVNKQERIKLICVRDENEEYYKMETNLYALDLRPWKEVVNIKIDYQTLQHYRFSDFLAHFLWEITFYGFNEKKLNKQYTYFKNQQKYDKIN